MTPSRRITRRLASLAGVLALVLPAAAAADPPGDWPRRAVGAGTFETASVRPDDRADRTRPTSDLPATTATALDEGVDWGNVAGFSLFLAAIGLGGTAMVWSHRRDGTAQRPE